MLVQLFCSVESISFCATTIVPHATSLRYKADEMLTVSFVYTVFDNEERKYRNYEFSYHFSDLLRTFGDISDDGHGQCTCVEAYNTTHTGVSISVL